MPHKSGYGMKKVKPKTKAKPRTKDNANGYANGKYKSGHGY